MSIPYEAVISPITGDVQFKIKGPTYFDYIDLWVKANNYDIVLENQRMISVVGSMTVEQFRKLKESNDSIR